MTAIDIVGFRGAQGYSGAKNDELVDGLLYERGIRILDYVVGFQIRPRIATVGVLRGASQHSQQETIATMEVLREAVQTAILSLLCITMWQRGLGG